MGLYAMKKIEKILLVDDDSINNFINARLLKKLEIADEVNISLNGEEAINYLNDCSNCPQLILLDINMPVMDGFGFLDCYNTCACCKNSPVIVVLTTSSNKRDLERLTEYPSVTAFLNKPLTEEKITKVVKEYFG